ncbi:MAG: acetyl-CoA carboxylase carboxyl transferase subunit beta [alpha proteobacterium HIMB114]|jgi:acetyl-CoA carboxylase carboxyl transferase subunit beta|nr:MAG: acetyl-CoA carboxylase carboxyl transferase subunit beta [alpha proteobacterium HIMB114]
MTNWLEKILSKAKQAKAKIGNAFKKIPLQNAELWNSCPECKKMFLGKQLKEDLYVCTQCDYHFRIGANERFKIFFDNEQYVTIETKKLLDDPNKFKTELKTYKDQLKSAKKKTGQNASLVSAYGKVNNLDIVCSSFDFNFNGGTLSLQSGQNFYEACEFAVNNQASALTVFITTGGAALQENLFALYQMPKTILGVQMLKENKIPYFVVANVNIGGVSASFGSLGDFHLMEPGKKTIWGFAGKRVVQGTISEPLPEDFQSSSHVITTGAIDMISHRKDQRDVITNLVSILLKKRQSLQNTVADSEQKEQAVNQ